LIVLSCYELRPELQMTFERVTRDWRELTAENDYTGAACRERVSRKLTAYKGYTAADEGLHGR